MELATLWLDTVFKKIHQYRAYFSASWVLIQLILQAIEIKVQKDSFIHSAPL